MSRALIVQTLDYAANKGDLCDPVYDALFAQHPEFEPLFALDRDKSVRGAMLQTALEYILLYTDKSPSLDAQLRGSRANHIGYGIADAHFIIFFEIIRDVVAAHCGAAWHTVAAQAWDNMLAHFART